MEEDQKAALKLLEAVGILHKKEYELIRIFPSFSPSGCYWRCYVSIKENFDKQYGIRPEPVEKDNGLYYSSGAMYEYFQGFEGKSATPEKIADELLERIPDLISKGKGSDPDYTMWFCKILKHARRGDFPYALSDGFDCRREGFLYCGDKKVELPGY